MRVLVTNDDGIDSAGLHALAEAAVTFGHDVVVAAPDRDWSGGGTALGPVHLTGRVVYRRAALPAPPGVPAFAVEGPPALAVVSAVLGGFGAPPDAVVSGVNAGANVGSAVLHSATVGAALTAAQYGCRTVAVSIAIADEWRWDTAARLAVALLPAVEPGHTANLNVPNVAPIDVRGVCAAPLAWRGTVQSAVVESRSETLELRLPAPLAAAHATDEALLAQGFATVTALSGLTSDTRRSRTLAMALDGPGFGSAAGA